MRRKRNSLSHACAKSWMSARVATLPGDRVRPVRASGRIWFCWPTSARPLPAPMRPMGDLWQSAHDPRVAGGGLNIGRRRVRVVRTPDRWGHPSLWDLVVSASLKAQAGVVLVPAGTQAPHERPQLARAERLSQARLSGRPVKERRTARWPSPRAFHGALRSGTPSA